MLHHHGRRDELIRGCLRRVQEQELRLLVVIFGWGLNHIVHKALIVAIRRLDF